MIMRNDAASDATNGFDVASVRRQFPIFDRQFPISERGNFHYLDSAATAQMPEAVFAATRAFDLEMRANVYGGVYRHAQHALAAYEQARAEVASFLGSVSPREVVFTYGTTSAINLLASSLGERFQAGDEVIISILEHHSNTLPWRALALRRGIELRVLPITQEGRLDLGELPKLLSNRCRLIALTHCSNVTGAVTDVPAVVRMAREAGALVMLDGAQMAPHGPVDVHALGIDFYAFSGHKTFGPTGIGVLWGRRALLEGMPPFMVGGQMIRHVTNESVEFADPPRRFEAGTPPIGAAIGLGAALRWMRALDWAAAAAHEQRLTMRVLDAIGHLQGAEIIGPRTAKDRRGVISFTLRGLSSEKISQLLDRRGVLLRHGHHCAEPLMIAYGIEGSARVSLAPYINDGDIDALILGLEEIAARFA